MFSNLVAGLATGDGIASAQENQSRETDKRMRYGISGDRLVHFAALRGDPHLNSWLFNQCFDATAGTTGTYIASILSNAMDLLALLERSKLRSDFSSSALSDLREQLRAVQGTRDTALHLVATYSTKQEFAGVVAALTRAADGSEPMDDAEIRYEWSSLFRLQNANGETVLHRAAAMSNFGVVSYICEHTPEVAPQLDSMNRSTLWHAACGGDHRIISVIGTALKTLEWAPTVDYPDDNGLTPLHVACREGYVDCVKALLDLGASPLCGAQSSGLTPIHHASLFGHFRCLETMAEHPDARSDFRKAVWMADRVDLIRPIHLAAANGWHDCVMLLIQYGSLLKPLASFMCIARASPSSLPLEPVLTSDWSLESTVDEVQVLGIQPSTPKEVAANRGWDLVVGVLEQEERGHLGPATGQPHKDLRLPFRERYN